MGSGASKNNSEAGATTTKGGKDARKLNATSPGSSQEIIQVGLTKSGFTPAELTINEGQGISISWDGNISHNVRQVVVDHHTIYSVPGGYYSGDPTHSGSYEIDFNLEGDYTFISDGYDAKSGKALVVTVRSRSAINVQVTDDGFSPSILRIRQGSSIKWIWNSTHCPRSVKEVRLCPRHTSIISAGTSHSVPAQSGSYKHDFQDPGLYYFQTEGEAQGQMHLCIVHVKEAPRHHGIEVTDRRFNPRLLTVKVGDRVWWHWNKFKCKKQHRILEMELPSGHDISDPFPRAVKGGFATDAPSRCGMLSHTFQQPGVYYYCDNNYEDNREYLGVVIVHPREKEYHVEVTADGFYPDLNVVSAGDRVWWSWEIDKVQDVFSILQVESCTVGNEKPSTDIECNNFCQYLSEESAAMVTGIGMATVNLHTPGVYQYRISDTPISVGGCSAIVSPAQKDHIVVVSDSGFEPKVLTIHPGDRVWWVWENTKKQHNIVQVSRHGQPISDGFCSGLPRDSPAAFMMQFTKLEPVYFNSTGLPHLYGAILVVNQSQVHQVLVAKNKLQPDPVLAQSNDCVAWVWPVLRTHGLTQVHGTQQVFELQSYTRDAVTPRRCCALSFTESGLYHYFSKAFSDKGDKFMFEHSSKTILSSVVVSESNDVRHVKVTSKCFNPPVINILKGQTIQWSWKDSSSEKHNIVHVNPPDHPKCYTPITGPDAFSSGEPQPNYSFVRTFEEPGSFYLTSEGASGCVGTVNVLEKEVCTSMPLIVSKCTGGAVEKWHKIELACNTENATIVYTMDGAIPVLHGATTRVYKNEKGICLKKSGLHIIRAKAVSDHMLPSKTFTSSRFWVLEGGKGDSSDDEDAVSIATEDFEEEQKLYTSGPTTKWQWWQCVPEIQGWFNGAGCLEVYWELPHADNREQVIGYQLFVNNICYHNSLPGDCHSVLVEGLAGGHAYQVSVIAMPKEQVYLAHQSNRLVVQVPVFADLGGPILSCECVGEDDCVSLVWPAIMIGGKHHQYVVYVNGKQHGDKLSPESCQDPPWMIIKTDNEQEDAMKMFVLALPPDRESDSDGHLSNILEIPMPLNLDHIKVPDDKDSKGIPYLLVKEGSGKPPDADKALMPSWNAEEDQFDELITTQAATSMTEVSATHASIAMDSDSETRPTSTPIDDEVKNKPHEGTLLNVLEPLFCMRVKIYLKNDTNTPDEAEVQEEVYNTEKMEEGVESDSSSQEKVEIGCNEDKKKDMEESQSKIEDTLPRPQISLSMQHVDADLSNVDAGKSNIDADQNNVDPDQSKVDADQNKIDADQSNVDPDQSNIDADQSKIDADHSNVDADQSNPDEHQSNVDADQSNIHADQRETDLQQQTNPLNDATLAQTAAESPNLSTNHNGAILNTQNDLHSSNHKENMLEEDSNNDGKLENDNKIKESSKHEDSNDTPSLAIPEAISGSVSGIQTVSQHASQVSARNEEIQEERDKKLHGKCENNDTVDRSSYNEASHDTQSVKNSESSSDIQTVSHNASNEQIEGKKEEHLDEKLDQDNESAAFNKQSGTDVQSEAIFESGNKNETVSQNVHQINDTNGEMQQDVDVVKEDKAKDGDDDDDGGLGQKESKRRDKQLSSGINLAKLENSDKSQVHKEKKKKKKEKKNFTGDKISGDSQTIVGHDSEAKLKEESKAPSQTSSEHGNKNLLDHGQHDTNLKHVHEANNGHDTNNQDLSKLDKKADDLGTDVREGDIEKRKLRGELKGADKMSKKDVEDVKQLDERKHGTKRTNLPIPMVTAQTSPKNAEVIVNWQYHAPDSQAFSLHHFMVSVEGSQFDKHIDSHFSKAEFHGNPDGGPILQHSWNAGQNASFVVNGLCENTNYSIFVTAVYCHQDLNRKHVRIHSKHVQCTTGGPPLPPSLQVTSIGCQEVTIGWVLDHCHEDIEVKGFILVRNRKATPELIQYGIAGKTIKNLKPGSKYHFNVIMVTSDDRKTKQSNTVTVTCPRQPDALQLSLDDMTMERAKITWIGTKGRHVTAYLVYVDGELYGEVEVNKHDPKNLQFNCKISTSDLAPGQSRQVVVKAYAGWRSMETPCKEAVCGIVGPDSNCVVVKPMDIDAPVVTPIPHLEGLHPGGIEISWAIPEEQANVTIAGYVILKDGEPVPPLLASNITCSTVTDIRLGAWVNLQVVAFAGPPGSPQSGASDDEAKIEDILENYTACDPGPILQVQYVGLVPPPPRVWSEIVGGHSALIAWEKGKKPRKHYVPAESYVVRWWETEDENASEQSDLTTDDHLLVTNLNPGAEYTVIVESRRHHMYTPHGPPSTAMKVAATQDSDEDEDEDLESYTCLVTGESEPLTITTASPPIPPKDLKVCVDYNVAHITWKPPVERGTEVLGLRIYATTKINKQTKTVFTTDLLPDATSTTISPLEEATLYAINLVTFTDEFFDLLPANSPFLESRDLPQDWTSDLAESPWLPIVSTKFTTAGHAPPTDLTVLGAIQGAVTVQWNSPVYASGALEKYEIEWADAKLRRHSPDVSSAGSVEVLDGKTSVVLQDLVLGRTYDISVTAVVKKDEQDKTNLKLLQEEDEEDVMRFTSEMLRYRVPAPIEALELFLTGYGCGHIELCWAKPELFTHQKLSGDSCLSASVRPNLLGYRLEVDGTTHCHLSPSTLSCTLTQCQPGRSYDVILVAMTTTDKHLAKKISGKTGKLAKLGKMECDEGQSQMMKITMPKLQSGNIISVIGDYNRIRRDDYEDEDGESSETERSMHGEIHVEWLLQDCGTASEQGIVGYDISWINVADGSEQTEKVSHRELSYDIPVYKQGCIYDISVQAIKEDHIWQDEDTPSIRVSVPGPSSPPKLCCTAMKPEEFILEWGEPRLYGGAGVRGYQVYMNDKKIGHELTTEHHKAAIPSRPDRTYRMSIVALSEDPKYDDSLPSDPLEIHTPPLIRGDGDDMDVTTMWRERNQRKKTPPLRLSEHPENISIGLVDSTDSTIVVEWRLPLPNDDRPAVNVIKVEWSSVAKPKELETLLKPSVCQYTIRNCTPGTNHFITVLTLDKADTVISRSKQLTVQTGAPLSTPELRIKHCNYAGCLLEWDKPTQCGNTDIVGYKLRVNGKTHDELPPKATTYLFTSGRMCKEYHFTLQALANVSTLDSQFSNSLPITWPGVVAPTLQRSSTGKVNSIRVTWNEPLLTGGAKIRYLKLTCHNESSDKDHQHGRHTPPKCTSPLPAHATSVEFNHLKPHTNYSILMSIHLEGITKAVRSRPLVTKVARRPLPPKNLRVMVKGLSERCTLETETCELINRRDGLLEELATIHHDVNVECTTNGYSEENAEARGETGILAELGEVEYNLMQHLEEMNSFTGLVYIDLMWDPEPDDGDAKITAYKVIVNGKQHGFLVNSCVTDLRMQLNAYDCIHQITMVAMTKHPVGNSNVSEPVTIDLSPFLPYSCYCLTSMHVEGERHPETGCCAYQHTLSQELSVEDSALKASLYQRTSTRHIPPASVMVTEVFDGTKDLLVPTKLSNMTPTILLFWTSWCLASQKMMAYYVQYARLRAEKYIFVTCCCGNHETPGISDYQSVAQLIANSGWREEGSVRHCCYCGITDAPELQYQGAGDMSSAKMAARPKSDQREPSSSSDSSGSALSVPELFGIQAIPMLIAIHPQGHIAWQGCLAALDSQSFNERFDEILAKVLKDDEPAPAIQTVSLASLKGGLPSNLPSQQDKAPKVKRHLPGHSSTSSSSTNPPRRQKSSKSSIEKAQKILSIQQGPYSASAKKDGRGGSSRRPKSSVTI